MYQQSMKYVIVSSMGSEVPILFDPLLAHNTICRKAISAGFVDIIPIADGVVLVNAYGESVSLNTESRGETDAKLICRMLSNCTRSDGCLYVTSLKK